MSKLVWDSTGNKLFETGIDRGVLYVGSESGVAWNGLTAVNESPSGAEATALYADNIKYLNLLSAEEFAATIEAYTYPEEFRKCLGETKLAPGIIITRQSRKHFAMCYRTLVGNDQDGTDYGYKIHIIYNCFASPTEKNYATVNDSPEAVTFSWEINTSSVAVDGYKPTANLVLDSTRFDEAGLSDLLEDIESCLYGSDDSEPTLLYPSDILEMLKSVMMDSDDNNLLDSNGELIYSTS